MASRSLRLLSAQVAPAPEEGAVSLEPVRSAQVAPEVVAEFAGHLLDAGFPALPTGPRGPGPSCRIVIGRHGDSENRCLVPVVPHEFVGPTSLAFAPPSWPAAAAARPS